MKTLLSILFALATTSAFAGEYATVQYMGLNGQKYFAVVEIWDDQGTADDTSDDKMLTVGVIADVNPTASDAILDENGDLKLDELKAEEYLAEIISVSQHESEDENGEVLPENQVRVYQVVVLKAENREPILNGPVTQGMGGC